MALEYRLILAGETPVNQVAARAFPEADERPLGVAPQLSADHLERYGFGVSILAGRHGYFDVQTDEGTWEWEPDAYVLINFRLDKFADAQRTVTNMLTVVRRLLETGSEDATFSFNGDILLFARHNGTLTKHRRATWWETNPAGDQLIQG
ncbi:SitI3 family protein [Paractinoplanes atraurantiacus]|uniref:Uncharacterized protein n=1 Tax=Paractinoplanes atraurantiacus TaxID=1036182 RepID=A0A285IHM6_9ACTN|nr:SitI3 family protein [Actinoplanes atraurantiacus]SNY47287.1 hypothetical protein SAMN05421748_108105 [Actinoplanes atraurantiacus]